MNPGDVLLLRRGTGILDRIVQIVTTSPYYHAAIVIDGGYLVEARFHGVAMRPVSEYGDRADVFQVLGATDAQREKACEFAKTKLHLPYGWKDILIDALNLGLHIPVGYRWKTYGHYDCSALVALAWATAGHPLTLCPVPTPGELGWSVALVGPRPWAEGG